MKITNESVWDITSLSRQYKLSIEIENIDKANKRKKQALRQQAKAIKRLNEENQALKNGLNDYWKMKNKETIGPKLNEKKKNGVISSGL